MKKTFIAISLMVVTANISFAEKILYQSKFDKLKPAENLFNSNESCERERLFPDQKTALHISLQPRKKRFNGFITATGTKTGELKLTPVKGEKFPVKRKGELILSLPSSSEDVSVKVSLRTENFLKKKSENNFFIYIAGANIRLRGDKKYIYYYSTTKKKYEHIIKLQNDKMYNINVNLHFGKKSSFDLSINSKELLKNKALRGNPDVLKTIKIVFATEQESASTPAPAIYLKNIKVFNN